MAEEKYELIDVSSNEEEVNDVGGKKESCRVVIIRDYNRDKQKSRSDVDISRVKSIKMTGCRNPEANDTYTRIGTEFIRKGKFHGENGLFKLWNHSMCGNLW